jgi:hypothetical protein
VSTKEVFVKGKEFFNLKYFKEDGEMKKVDRMGKGFLSVLVLGLAVGALLSFGCGEEKVVIDINKAPVLDSIGSQPVDLGGPLTIVVTASDPDGDELTFSAINLPTGATFDEATQTFSWTPEPGVIPEGTYEVTFIVSDDKGKTDCEVVVITVSAVAATGTANTGKYSVIAYNFPTGAGTCSDYFGGSSLCNMGIPAPGCEEITPPLFAVQSEDDVIFYLNFAGQSVGMIERDSVKNDGSFTVSEVFELDIDGPVTLSMTITGKVSPDKVEGSMEVDVEWDGGNCDWGYDFIGPGLGNNSNATITVSGFTSGKEGVNVYAFVRPNAKEPWAIGGSEIAADGSTEIQLRPALRDGLCFNVAVWLDIDGADGDIIDCWENNGEFICGDDLCAWISKEDFCVNEGSITFDLEAGDFSEGGCLP